MRKPRARCGEEWGSVIWGGVPLSLVVQTRVSRWPRRSQVICFDMPMKEAVPKYFPIWYSDQYHHFSFLWLFMNSIQQKLFWYPADSISKFLLFSEHLMKTCSHCLFLKVIYSLFFQRFNLWDSASEDILRGLDGGRNERHLSYRHGGNQQSAGKCSQPSTVHVPGNNSSKQLLWKPALLKE